MKRFASLLKTLLGAALLLGMGCRSPICPWCGHDVRQKPPVVPLEKFLPAGTVKGTLTTLEHGELHPMAKAVIQLHDVTLHAGDDPVLIAELAIDSLHTLPVTFEIPYPEETIHAEREYLVSAKIVVGTSVLFSTDTRYPVLTRGAPNRISLCLVRKK